jgi:hypothetical protein
MRFRVAVISSGRPASVPVMEQHCAGLNPVWYVGAGETVAYQRAGAANVTEGGSLADARNQALDDAGDAFCVQVSDDLRKVSMTTGKLRDNVTQVPLDRAVRAVGAAMSRHHARLGGCAPTANPFFSAQRVHPSGYIVGDLIVVAPGEPRFDPQFRLKEDYDFTCQHLRAYGSVARVDYLLADFAHRKNPGGAVAYRTAELEDQAIERLMIKWPGVFRGNPRRPHEVLLKWGACSPVIQGGYRAG